MAERHPIKCLKCKNGAAMFRIRRGFVFKVLLAWLPVKRYRCTRCAKKTYILGTPRPFRLQVVH